MSSITDLDQNKSEVEESESMSELAGSDALEEDAGHEVPSTEEGESGYNAAPIGKESKYGDSKGMDLNSSQIVGKNKERKNRSIDDIALRITFSLGALWATREELYSIKKDDVFNLESDYSGHVSIIAENCEIGIARIVSINDSLALQIVEINN